MSKEKVTRELEGKEEALARRNLDFMSKFGISSIEFGSRKITKKDKKVIETRSVRKTNKK